MRSLLAALLLAVAAPAQLFAPYNVEGMPGAYIHPFTKSYRPHILVQWDPSVTPFPLRTHSVGIQVELTVREIVVFHPPYWTGSWGGAEIGTRLKSENFSTIYNVWPWSGGSYEYLRGLDIELNAPGEIGIDYGTWGGACCYGYSPRPTLCAMIIEVSL